MNNPASIWKRAGCWVQRMVRRRSLDASLIMLIDRETHYDVKVRRDSPMGAMLGGWLNPLERKGDS